MASEDISLKLKTDAFKKALEQIPGYAKKDVSKMVAEFQKGSKAIEKDAAVAAKKVDGVWKNIADASGFGGLFGQLEKATAGAEGLGLGAGAAGLAVAGIAAAGVAAAVGIYKLERAGREALDALDAVGQGDLVTDAQRAQVEEANSALDAMGVAADALTVSLASELAGGVTELAEKFTSLELFTKKVADAFDTGSLSVKSWGNIVAAFMLEPIKLTIDGLNAMDQALGISNPGIEASAAMVDGWSKELADNSLVIVDNTEEQKAANRENTDAAPIVAALTEKRKKDSAAAREQAAAAKELAKAYHDELSAMDKLGIIGQKASEDTLDPVQKLTVAYEDQIVEIGKTKDAAIAAAMKAGASETDLADITAVATAAEADVTSRYLRDRNGAYGTLAEAAATAEQKIADANKAQTDATISNQQHVSDDAKAKQKEIVTAALDAAASMISALSDIADAESAVHQTRLEQAQKILDAEKSAYKSKKDLREADERGAFDSARARVKHEKTALLEMFIAKKAASISEIAINASVAVMQALAQLGPIAGGIAVGGILATAAVQAGIVAAQKPPKLHLGKAAPDEYDAVLKRGEGVATASAMADPVFRQQLEDHNANRPQGGQSGGTNVYLNDRLISAIDARQARLRVPATRQGMMSHYG